MMAENLRWRYAVVLLLGYASLGAVEVELSWQASGEGDIVGYNVYRADPAALRADPAQRVAARVALTRWRDTGVPNRASVAYGLTAVDADGNESQLCTPASVALTRDAFRRIDPEHHDGHVGAAVHRRGARYTVAPVAAGDRVRLDRVDFADGAALVTIELASESGGAELALHLDGTDGAPVAVIDVPATGAPDRFAPVTVPVDALTGVHDLHLVFVTASPAVAVDHLHFSRHARRVDIDSAGQSAGDTVEVRLDGDPTSDAAVPASLTGLDPGLAHRLRFLVVPGAPQ